MDGWLNVQNFVEQELLRTGQRCFFVVEKGEITGLVTPHEAKQVDHAAIVINAKYLNGFIDSPLP